MVQIWQNSKTQMILNAIYLPHQLWLTSPNQSVNLFIVEHDQRVHKIRTPKAFIIGFSSPIGHYRPLISQTGTGSSNRHLLKKLLNFHLLGTLHSLLLIFLLCEYIYMNQKILACILR